MDSDGGKKESKRRNKDAVCEDQLAVRISLFSMAKEPSEKFLLLMNIFLQSFKVRGPRASDSPSGGTWSLSPE